MLKKATVLQQAMALILILALLCSLFAFLGMRNSRGLAIPMSGHTTAQQITVEQPEIARADLKDGTLYITPLSVGQTVILAGDETIAMVSCRKNGFVHDEISEHYSGDRWAQGAMTLFLLGGVIILHFALLRQGRRQFYHYATPLLAALLLLFMLNLLPVAWAFFTPDSTTLERILCDQPALLLLYLLPLVVLFTLAMFISNLSLLRHEGPTWRNLLGSLIGFAMALATLIITLISDVSGSQRQIQFHTFFTNFLSGVVLWTECKLVGISLCGVQAASHQPALDKDFVLILGCKLSRKGGLTPLLRGRVDRALRFARQQAQSTGRMPMLIPCGGKGSDEKRSEAAAIRDYLLEQGVSEEIIIAEDRSENTWQNLRNAKAMMPAGAKVAYATTNYHVFRAGVWACRNGLPAEGMGSKTKLYYWPNAFMREYVALVTANWRHEAMMLITIGLQSGLFAYLHH